MGKRLISLEEQKETNEYLVGTINSYWEDLGVEANARVEKRLVEIPFNKTFKKIWSYEIVSALSEFAETEKYRALR